MWVRTASWKWYSNSIMFLRKICAYTIHMYTTTKSLQSCLTLCDPMDCSPPGFSIHGILQTRILEWVAISFSNAWKWKVKVKSLSPVRLLATPWTAAYQAPPSMGFSSQLYWSGVPLPSIHVNYLCTRRSLDRPYCETGCFGVKLGWQWGVGLLFTHSHTHTMTYTHLWELPISQVHYIYLHFLLL